MASSIRAPRGIPATFEPRSAHGNMRGCAQEYKRCMRNIFPPRKKYFSRRLAGRCASHRPSCAQSSFYTFIRSSVRLPTTASNRHQLHLHPSLWRTSFHALQPHPSPRHRDAADFLERAYAAIILLSEHLETSDAFWYSQRALLHTRRVCMVFFNQIWSSIVADCALILHRSQEHPDMPGTSSLTPAF